MVFDLLLYLFPLLALYVSRLASGPDGAINNRVGQFLFFSMPLLVLVAFRGNVGTDTANYVEQFELRHQGGELLYGTFEPGFELLVTGLLAILNDARTAVNFISAANVLITIFALRRWGGDLKYSASTIVPAFIFDFTMNGLRMGTAFPLVICAVLLFERKRVVGFVTMLAIAASIQISALPLAALLLIDKIAAMVKPKTAIMLIVVGAVLFNSFGAFFIERIVSKADFYELLQKPDAASGLAPLLFSVLFFGFSLIKQSETFSYRTAGYSLFFTALQFGAYQVSQITYAGLRLQLLILFAHMLYAQRHVFPLSRHRIFNNIVALVLFFLFASWKLRSFIVEDPNGPSPFLPYHFFWS